MEHKGFDQYTADLLTLGRYIADAANIKSCANAFALFGGRKCVLERSLCGA